MKVSDFEICILPVFSKVIAFVISLNLSSLSEYLDLAARSVSLASLKVNCCWPNISIGQA